MKSNFVLTRIWNIPIGVNFSWFIIFAFLLWSLSAGFVPSAVPGQSIAFNVLAALVMSLLFFGALLAHELGHVFVALREGIPVRAVTLFIFGGVAQIEKEPESAGSEFRIAAAGPLVSFALAGLFAVPGLLTGLPEAITAPLGWLARVNLILAVFNLIPGFPLDGGRIFRAIVWRLTGDAYKATRVAGIGGQLVGGGFIALAIFTAFTSGIANGLWLGFIGWFLLSAASGSLAYAKTRRQLAGLQVSEVMRREIPQVSPLLPIRYLVQQYMLGLGHRVLYVGEGSTPEGVISLDKIAQLGKGRWEVTTTRQVMTPLQGHRTVTPDTDLAEAMELMDRNQLSVLPVEQDGEIVGALTRADISKALEVRSRLKII